MPQVLSTLSKVDWRSMAMYTANNPKQALINAALAYYAFRQILRFGKRITIYGVRSTFSAMFRGIAGALLRHIRRAPGTGIIVQRNIAAIGKEIEKDMIANIPGESRYLQIPSEGMSDAEILEVLERRQHEAGVDWENGRASGAVYHGGEEMVKLTNEAYGMFNLSNPLHPGVFPGLRRIEAEVVQMVLDLYNADSECCGTTTSGGTESIIMAVRTHVVWAREERGINNPNIIVPVTIHAAFDKAAEYFRIGITHVPVDPITGQADL
ncbi:Dihydrosphingosine phosphate lyase, partial [Linderina macrospora]